MTKIKLSEAKAELQEIADLYGLKLNSQDFQVIFKIFRVNALIKKQDSQFRRDELLMQKRSIIKDYKENR